MAEKNYRTVAVIPEMPRTIDEQQLYVYVPQGTTSNFGIFKPDGKQFVITADGILRVDASKLIQLATPSAQVVEDGGETSAEVQFTETDHTLLRQFQFIFKNIKGATGQKGDTGLAALECSYVKTANIQPLPLKQINIPLNTFNRTPLPNEIATCYYIDSTASITYLIRASIISLYDDQAICYIDSVLQLTGGKGADGLDALVYSGTYTETSVGDVADEPIHLDLANFSRIPVKGDTFILVYYTTENEQTTIALFSIYEVYEDYVEAQLVLDTQYVITGPQGEQGTPGTPGTDGVSVTSVTQTGVQGGTLVTITLSDGQSTSFTVYNGINTNFQIVQTLPTSDISTSTIYLVPADDPGEQNVYDEYIYVNGAWEHIGSTSVDLSDYVTKTYFDQTVGTATKNYINAQISKIQNMYIEMFESGSVPAKGQALTLTNSNFARVPAQGQYFSLIEVVNTKDKYYTVCKIASVDTTTCSATVEAVTELDSGTEIEAIKASIQALTTTVNGKADASALDGKLDKVTTATTNRQAYVKNANGTQGMVDIGGTSNSNLATVEQLAGKADTTALNGKLDRQTATTPLSKAYVKNADGTQAMYDIGGTDDDDIANVGQMNAAIAAATSDLETTSNKTTSLSDSSTDTQYPSAKAVVDYVKENAGSEPYHLEMVGQGLVTADQFAKLLADEDSYILWKATSSAKVQYKFRRTQMSTDNTELFYSGTVSNGLYSLQVKSGQNCISYVTPAESTGQKTNTLSSSSTNTQYPNAKATYDYGQTVLTEAKSYADTAIANAITTALNTPV